MGRLGVSDTTVFVVPTVPGLPNYTMRTRFDGVEYNLRFLWNEREERWYMSILSLDEVVLVAGAKIVSNWQLLRYYQWDDRLPKGELMAVDLSGDGSPPGLYDLGVGKRVELTYYGVTGL